jgi:enoyl-CoA hydratase
VYETLDVTVDNGAARLTLNRPDKLNAISDVMMRELGQAFTALDEDQTVKVVVLSGAGERAFSAGADLGWSERMTPKDRAEHTRLGQRTFGRMEQMGKPVFAAVHGYALGGGLELALAADWIVCSSNARLGFPEITLSADKPYRPKIAEDGDPDQPEFGGSGPGWGAIARLPQRIGKANALHLMLTGERIDGQRAYELGLATRLYPEDRYDEEVAELARRLAAMNHYNLRLIKELVVKGYDLLELHPS